MNEGQIIMPPIELLNITFVGGTSRAVAGRRTSAQGLSLQITGHSGHDKTAGMLVSDSRTFWLSNPTIVNR